MYRQQASPDGNLHGPVGIGGLKVSVDGISEISFDVICVLCKQIVWG